MTRDNMIFLGACSMLAFGPTYNMTTQQFSKAADDALAWSASIYDKQHGGNISAPTSEPTSSGWVVETLICKNWLRSGNAGLEGVVFPTNTAAEAAIKEFGSDGVSYRAVQHTPEVWIVEKRKENRRNWKRSFILNKEYVSKAQAEAAIKDSQRLGIGYEYRAVRK